MAVCSMPGCKNWPVVAWDSQRKVLCHTHCEEILDSLIDQHNSSVEMVATVLERATGRLNEAVVEEVRNLRHIESEIRHMRLQPASTDDESAA